MTLSLFNYSIDFDSPGWLVLLGVIPVLWLMGRQSLTALGKWRRMLALLGRAALVTGLVLALADVQIVRKTDRLAVIYLLDRSLSVSPTEGARAIEFINQSRAAYRDAGRGDLAGVIVFGRQASVELPPLAENVPLLTIETHVDPDFTDLASGLRLARACFPPDCAKRLVILSDGNENVESAREEAQALLDAEIGVDVVPLRQPRQADIAVEKVTLSREVQRGAPFEVRAVVNSLAFDPNAGPVAGKLRVLRRSGVDEQLVAEEPIEVQPGRRVYSFRQQIEEPDFYTYDVQFVPAEPGEDGLPQNNRATAFTQVRGPGRVLLIEDGDHAGEYAHLAERLRAAQIDVDVRSSHNCFANLADLQRYDAVVMANVPRTSGGADLVQFSDEQIGMLVTNTQQLGAGLVLLGGPNSFGAGGWTNTPLEAAMPVDFQVKNAKVVPQGALLLVIDSSGSMSGDKIAMSRAAAVAAVQVLGERDFVGVVTFDSAATTVVPLQRVGTGAKIANRIGTIASGGGTNMMPGMEAGYAALMRADAAVKHMIVLTDGQTEGAGFEALSAQMRRRDITTTSVAIGSDAATGLMQRIATAGGGKFYRVENPRVIPRIFMKEAMRVARPLVYENPAGVRPQFVYPHEMLRGISEPVPPVTGYVLTTAKSNPLVEVSWTAPLPSPGTHPLLASWTYGLGRSAVLTTDAGQRWAKQWVAWENYDKLFAQLVRWSMRPTTGDSRFALATETRDGKLQVVINALDHDEGYLNFLVPRGTVIDPEMQSSELKIEQVAPGRYVAEAPAEKAGNYFVNIVPGPDMAPLRTGVNVSYSAEFRQIGDENNALLESLAQQTPPGGRAGRMLDIDQPTPAADDHNVFRRDLPQPTSRESCWHLLLFGVACLFFVDVLNRRVAFSLAPVQAVARRVTAAVSRRSADTEASEVLDRLRVKKQEVANRIDQLQAGARWEGAATRSDALTEPLVAAASPVAATATAPTLEAQPSPEEDSYTARLLKAKQKIRAEQQQAVDLLGKTPQ
ncbi:MAG: VWA domain-containing protein [Planctomycetaceae bacterium]|nr:VWA domain-containing protein [Planctomycetaceae bacterium]